MSACTEIPTKENEGYQEDNYVYSDNALIPQYVRVYEEVNFKKQADEHWLSGIDTNLFYHIEQKLFATKIKKYDAAIFLDENTDTSTFFNKQEIEARKEGLKTSLDALYFTENWKFNKKEYRLEKDVLMWTPVYFCKKVYKDTIMNIKKVIFDIHNKKLKNKKQIASDITYEFSLTDDKDHNNTLNAKRLINLLLEPVLKGEKAAYDFDTNQKYSIAEMKERLGERIDSLEVENPVTGEITWEVRKRDFTFEDIDALIFTEDWYMDMDNFSIQKDVKSISPVKFIYDIDGNLRKRILFRIDFKK